MTPTKDLVQPGQFACEEKVEVVGSKGSLGYIRVLGPVRPETQVELSMTDARKIGISAPVRESGKLEDTPGCKLIGPNGEVDLEHGVIVAWRHIHLSAEQAKEAGLKDHDIVKVRLDGERSLTFENVLVRAGNKHKKEMHLDTDEANAAGCTPATMGEVIK